MMTVSCVCVLIRTTDNNEIFAFNQFLHKHINKTNTINTVDCTQYASFVGWKEREIAWQSA